MKSNYNFTSPANELFTLLFKIVSVMVLSTSTAQSRLFSARSPASVTRMRRALLAHSDHQCACAINSKRKPAVKDR